MAGGRAGAERLFGGLGSGARGAADDAAARPAFFFLAFEGGELVVDAESGVFDSLFVAGGFVESEDLAESGSGGFEFVGGFEGGDGFFSFAEFFFGLGESDEAGRDATFKFESLIEGHFGFFVGASFEVNQAGVMKRGRVVVERLSDFETFDGFVEFLLFGIEDAEAVVGGGVFFVELEDGKEGFFGP